MDNLMITPILGALSKIGLHLILLLPILRDQQILFTLPFLGSCLRYQHPIAFLSKSLGPEALHRLAESTTGSLRIQCPFLRNKGIDKRYWYFGIRGPLFTI